MSHKTRNAVKTKERILNAAETLFAAKGFSSTTISQIAKKSKVSGALIMFHFKNKKNIYTKVKARIISRYSDDYAYTISEHQSLKDLITVISTSIFNFYKENPRMIRLAGWSYLEGDIIPWHGEDELHQNFISNFIRLQNEGQIRVEASPVHSLIMLCGSIHKWWEHHRHLVKQVSHQDTTLTPDQMFLSDLITHTIYSLRTQLDSDTNQENNND